MASLEDIEYDFPALVGTAYSEESAATDSYNCIAFAFGDLSNAWWPRRGFGYYWPPGFPLSDSTDVLIAIFELHGYSRCDTPEYEVGQEKVAIYSIDGRFKHAARQLRSGRWASKLGDEQDIEHVRPEHLHNPSYGIVTHFLKRSRNDWLVGTEGVTMEVGVKK
jgi:hypothetical protein